MKEINMKEDILTWITYPAEGPTATPELVALVEQFYFQT